MVKACLPLASCSPTVVCHPADKSVWRGGIYCVEAARAEPLTGMRLNLFFKVTLCRLILSSGEKRAGWADMVMVVPTDFFKVYKRLPGWGEKGVKRGFGVVWGGIKG